MTSLVHAVHPALAGLVTSMVGFDLWLDADAAHFGVPSPSATVLIALGDPFDVGWVGECSTTYPTLVAGLHMRPSIVRTHGRQYGIQLALTPPGVRALLGLPLSEVTHRMVTLDHLSGVLSGEVAERLAAVDGWGTRFRLVENELIHRVIDADPGLRPEVTQAWRILETTWGDASVSAMAQHVGWSRRYLTTHFTSEFGVGPKQAARLHRYTRSRRLIDAGVSPVDVATRCGFSDQAHLSREWKCLGGQSPSHWEEFPILQADLGPTAAD